MKKYKDVYAELEYFNNHNTLVYYRNNLSRDNFIKINNELYTFNDLQTFRGLTANIEITVHSSRLKDIFDDKIPDGIYIKGGLNGFGIVIVVAEKIAINQFHFKIGKIEINIVFSGTMEKLPWNDKTQEKTYLKTYRMNSLYNTSIPNAFNAGSWHSK